jgi:hypothetical protein
VSAGRRRALAWALAPAAQLLVPIAWAQGARLASARVWPAHEYTRVIFESPAPLAWQVLTLKDPDRVVLDLEGVEAGPSSRCSRSASTPTTRTSRRSATAASRRPCCASCSTSSPAWSRRRSR